MRYVVAVFVWMLLFCGPVIAREVETGEKLVPKSQLHEILDVIWKAAIPAVIAYLLKKHRDKTLLARVVGALELGVTDSYENFVRPLKHDTEGEHPNGKLKEGERQDARTWARNKAEEVLTGGARRLFLGLAERQVNSMIEGIVSKRKTK